MTEEEWLRSDDPTTMLWFLRGKASDRKLQLLVVASSRHIWDLLPAACRRSIEWMEIYSDDRAAFVKYRTEIVLDEAENMLEDREISNASSYAKEAVSLSFPPTIPSCLSCLSAAANAVSCSIADRSIEGEYDATLETMHKREVRGQVRLLLEIFGNPFRPIVLEPSWLTATVVALAQGIYEERAFDRIPILADALQDAGCDNAAILDHCRDPASAHVRGCWVVDLLLNKV